MQTTFITSGKPALLAALLALAPAASLFAGELHVAVDGKDTNAGTPAAPFATVQRAEKSAGPGDTVFIHGGTYKMTEKQIATFGRGRALVIDLTKSGRPGKPICYFAFAGEKPVFDFSEVKPPDNRVTAFNVTGSWLHFKGLAVTGVQVTITGHTQSICFDNDGSHNIYEQLQMHDGQAIGFWLGQGSDNLVLNCDAYRNYDFTSENGRGGNVDGFGFHAPKGSTGNIFRGCRAWFNSDDGFDLISTFEPILIENCWAFYNGFDSNFKSRADGNGFKLGGYGDKSARQLPSPIPRHIIRQSLAVRNKAAGFYANHQPGGIDFINNSAYLNSVNFNLLGRDSTNSKDVPGHGHKMTNNLGYKGRTEVNNLNRAACDLAANSFDLGLRLSDKDFHSLNQSDLVQPRMPNGDLPVVPFMKLKAGNNAIDKGVDASLAFKGKAPDLGAFEFGVVR
ncbi:MAG: right-handed parallel beta-helix repeat-containing protein [Verrucomicrobiota bacterium]